jgi:hypothetical protein
MQSEQHVHHELLLQVGGSWRVSWGTWCCRCRVARRLPCTRRSPQQASQSSDCQRTGAADEPVHVANYGCKGRSAHACESATDGGVH